MLEKTSTAISKDIVSSVILQRCFHEFVEADESPPKKEHNKQTLSPIKLQLDEFEKFEEELNYELDYEPSEEVANEATESCEDNTSEKADDSWYEYEPKIINQSENVTSMNIAGSEVKIVHLQKVVPPQTEELKSTKLKIAGNEVTIVQSLKKFNTAEAKTNDKPYVIPKEQMRHETGIRDTSISKGTTISSSKEANIRDTLISKGMIIRLEKPINAESPVTAGTLQFLDGTFVGKECHFNRNVVYVWGHHLAKAHLMNLLHYREQVTVEYLRIKSNNDETFPVILNIWIGKQIRIIMNPSQMPDEKQRETLLNSWRQSVSSSNNSSLTILEVDGTINHIAGDRKVSSWYLNSEEEKLFSTWLNTHKLVDPQFSNCNDLSLFIQTLNDETERKPYFPFPSDIFEAEVVDISADPPLLVNASELQLCESCKIKNSGLLGAINHNFLTQPNELNAVESGLLGKLKVKSVEEINKMAVQDTTKVSEKLSHVTANKLTAERLKEIEEESQKNTSKQFDAKDVGKTKPPIRDMKKILQSYKDAKYTFDQLQATPEEECVPLEYLRFFTVKNLKINCDDTHIWFNDKSFPLNTKTNFARADVGMKSRENLLKDPYKNFDEIHFYTLDELKFALDRKLDIYNTYVFKAKNEKKGILKIADRIIFLNYIQGKASNCRLPSYALADLNHKELNPILFGLPDRPPESKLKDSTRKHVTERSETASKHSSERYDRNSKRSDNKNEDARRSTSPYSRRYGDKRGDRHKDTRKYTDRERSSSPDDRSVRDDHGKMVEISVGKKYNLSGRLSARLFNIDRHERERKRERQRDKSPAAYDPMEPTEASPKSSQRSSKDLIVRNAGKMEQQLEQARKWEKERENRERQKQERHTFNWEAELKNLEESNKANDYNEERELRKKRLIEEEQAMRRKRMRQAEQLLQGKEREQWSYQNRIRQAEQLLQGKEREEWSNQNTRNILEERLQQGQAISGSSDNHNLNEFRISQIKQEIEDKRRQIEQKQQLLVARETNQSLGNKTNFHNSNSLWNSRGMGDSLGVGETYQNLLINRFNGQKKQPPSPPRLSNYSSNLDKVDNHHNYCPSRNVVYDDTNLQFGMQGYSANELQESSAMNTSAVWSNTNVDPSSFFSSALQNRSWQDYSKAYWHR